MNREEFLKDQSSYNKISSLLPYYNYHPEMRSVILLKSPFEKYKLLSKIYPYNSLLFAIIAGNSEFNKSRDNNNDENGYVPLERIWKGQLTTDSSQAKYELDSVKINVFNSFIRDCLASDIKLYIFISPAYIKYKMEDQSVEIAKKIAKKS